MNDVVMAVDVGSASARAGLFARDGNLIAWHVVPIRQWRPKAGYVEQSSTDIWSAVVTAVRGALKAAGPGHEVRGIAFDATCSLVVVDAGGAPVTVSPTGIDEQNIMMWMDHRAEAQAERIIATHHKALDYLGGRISPEMETPKLLWLKENMPETWARAGHFLDLSDFLTWKATGDLSRSISTTTAKWVFLGHEDRFDDDYYQTIGLGDLVDEGFARIGTKVLPIGTRLGKGLVPEVAKAFCLPAGTPVGVAILDGAAGGVGVVGGRIAGETTDFSHRLALVGGTSSCHMAVTEKPLRVTGVWGPYYSAMVPGLWQLEGGQSSTGSLIDHVIKGHASYGELQRLAEERGTTIYAVLNERLDELAPDGDYTFLTEDLHVLPYFLGNRSPRADASLKGMVVGLTLSNGINELAVLYLATLQAIAYGTRHIVETMNAAGLAIDTLMLCGGGAKNPVFVRTHADATGCRIVLSDCPEPVLLGTAVVAANVADPTLSIPEAMSAMTVAGDVVAPSAGRVADFHARKMRVFLKMYEDFIGYRRLMQP